MGAPVEVRLWGPWRSVPLSPEYWGQGPFCLIRQACPVPADSLSPRNKIPMGTVVGHRPPLHFSPGPGSQGIPSVSALWSL